jgi:hypothetical protein
VNVETALKSLLDPASIILFEACSTENSKGKAGRLIRAIDLKVLQAGKFTSAFLFEKLIILIIILSKGGRRDTKVRAGDTLSNLHKCFCGHTSTLFQSDKKYFLQCRRLAVILCLFRLPGFSFLCVLYCFCNAALRNKILSCLEFFVVPDGNDGTHIKQIFQFFVGKMVDFIPYANLIRKVFCFQFQIILLSLRL